MLNQLLLRKFSHIPTSVQEHIATANLPTLQQWTMQVLDAERIEDIFEPPL